MILLKSISTLFFFLPFLLFLLLNIYHENLDLKILMNIIFLNKLLSINCSFDKKKRKEITTNHLYDGTEHLVDMKTFVCNVLYTCMYSFSKNIVVYLKPQIERCTMYSSVSWRYIILIHSNLNRWKSFYCRVFSFYK